MFLKGAEIVNESKKRKVVKERRKSEGGSIVSTIRRKLSTVDNRTPTIEPTVVVGATKQCSEVVGMNTISEIDVDVLDLNIEQSGDTVTVTVLNEIDRSWFRKSVKTFFQWQLLQNGII